jgi:hypothetical protein
MRGVFSSETVAESIELPSWEIRQYHVQEGSIDVFDVMGDETELVATRRWEVRSDIELAMLPNEDELEDTLEWIVTRGEECGPHELGSVRFPGNRQVFGRIGNS